MAKYIMVPGTYTAGQDIPLRGTILTGGGSQFHEPDSPIVQLKGSGCPRNPARYNVNVGVTFTAAAAAPLQAALIQDGIRVTAGLLAAVPAAIGDVITVSVPNEVSAADTSRVSVRAVSTVTITEGALTIHRTA